MKKTLSFNKNKETAHKKDMVTIGSRRDMLKKLALTAGLVFLFQALSYVPTPFISHRTLKYIADNNLFGTVSLFSGDSFQNLTLMATGISSYVSASIVMQLLMNFMIFPEVQMEIKSLRDIQLSLVCLFPCSRH